MITSEEIREITREKDYYLSEDTRFTLSDQAGETAEIIAEIINIIQKNRLNILEAREILRDTEKIMYLGARL